jgi:NDP-sugar pyrophosphorylase family protein
MEPATCRKDSRTAELSDCPALILAGGLGTRLRSVYSSGPKCMVPVKNRPFLEYLLVWLRRSGLNEIVLCVGYKRSQIQRWFRQGRRWGVRISYSVETSPLGTGGALRNAATLIKAKSVLVLNGDTFADVDLPAMLHFHEARGAKATVALAKVTNMSRYGTVVIDDRNRITAFKEKAQAATGHAVNIGYINAGVYVLDSKLLYEIPSGRQVSLEREIFPQLVQKDLYGFRTDGYFIDIGVPEDLRRANIEMRQEPD